MILTSGYSTDPVMAHHQDYGFCAALTKPFDLTMLNSSIEKVNSSNPSTSCQMLLIIYWQKQTF
ncbi:MAG: hypothetical protein D6B25_06305 [Desulfobulbaceae bacterium]|nr:MAG: hypothetical protein D6B25_06305 [Desulfobulbaceae bacterium]